MATSKKSPTSTPVSRYEHVKAILNDAQGDVDVSYQGYGRFWDLPWEDFLAVKIYGVQMIAPWSEGTPTDDPDGCDCCDCDNCDDSTCACEQPGTDFASHSCRGRGTASGLIKGLRGQAPFDGTQFPRLLWGPKAKPVSDADIQFIEDWIDDCCPADDSQALLESDASSRLLLQKAYGEVAHTFASVINEHKSRPEQIKVRKNIESLTDDEFKRLRAALGELECLNKYPRDERNLNSWARIHATCPHGLETFLTWHRAYLYSFELALQKIDSSVTLPYWDWVQYPNQPIPSGKKEKPGNDTGVIPERFGCWIDDTGLGRLKGKIASGAWDKLNNIKGQVFLSGNRLYMAAKIDYQGAAPDGQEPTEDDRIMAELQRTNSLWYRQRWPGMNTGLIAHYPTTDDVDYILQIPDFAHWGGGPVTNPFYGEMEKMHNYMHNFAGGVNPNYKSNSTFVEPQNGHMVDTAIAGFDPIFWAHHTNIDRLFAKWQEMHPGANPQKTDIVLRPFDFTVLDTLDISHLGYEYVQDAHYTATNNRLGFRRFGSEKAAISKPALQNHRRVEVRLHGVQVLQRAANIRVFLNQPDANVETSIERNDHYVGDFMTFVGACYGGPGHCDVPPAPGPFDYTMRHHKTPGNISFDATRTVQKLLTQAGTQAESLPLSINLVVTDTQGEPGDDLLKMDGVSINFIG